jgi:HPt (histidine-containing phosphotransfer) domain-containing protein
MDSNNLNGHLDYSRAMVLINDEDIVEEMLVMLMDSLKDDLPSLQAAAAANQWLTLSQIVHRIKGVLPLFCDEQTAELVTGLESQFKEKTPESNSIFTPSPAALAQFEQVLIRLDEFLISVETWLKGRTKQA